MRSPTGRRPSLASARPKASWLELCGGYDSSRRSGTSAGRGGRGGRREDGRPRDHRRLGAARGEARPLVAGRDPEPVPQLVELGLGQERAVVHRVARERQAPPLDRVGEDHARPGPVPLRLRIGLDDGDEVMAAHVADQRLKRLVRAVREEPVEGHVGLAVARGDERLPHRAGGQADERVVLGIGHGLEPRPETLAAGPGEGRVKPRAPAQLDDVPARGGEPRAELAPPRIGDDAVEALPIHVDDPQEIAQLGERRPRAAPPTRCPRRAPRRRAWRRSAAGAPTPP